MSAAKIVARISGFFLLLSGLFGTAVPVFSMLDPGASKMADDGDPFGTPPSLLDSFLILLVYLGVSGVGAFLVWSSVREPPASA
jgi:hypothetical protein